MKKITKLEKVGLPMSAKLPTACSALAASSCVKYSTKAHPLPAGIFI
jgi:hypothetical protein